MMLVPRIWYLSTASPDPVFPLHPLGNLRGATQALQEAGKESVVGGIGCIKFNKIRINLKAASKRPGL